MMRRSPVLLLVSMLVVTAVGVAPSAADDHILTVDAVDDAVDVDPGDGTCADADGRCTLRAAVMEASATPAPSTIVLPAGTFTLTLEGPDADEDELDPAVGDLEVTAPLSIVGAGRDETVVRGAAGDRLFDVRGAQLSLHDLSLADGAAIGEGGAVRVLGGALEATRVTFEGNTASSDGGAIHGTAADVTLAGVLVRGNYAGVDGGGTYVEHGELSVSATSFIGNGAVRGGAIAAYDATGLSVTGSEIEANAATSSGGGVIVAAHTGDSPPTFEFSDVVFGANRANGSGGAVFVDTLSGPGGPASLRITGSDFQANDAFSGGAVFVDAGGFTVSGSLFADNVAHQLGGAVYGYDPYIITGSVFGRNVAGEDGGAVFADDDLVIDGSTFTANEAGGAGGAIAGERAVQVTAARFHRNDAGGGGGALHGGSAGTVTIRSSALDENLALGAGGAIWGLGEVVVTNSTVSGNQASIGGGIEAASLALTGATVADNAALEAGGINTYGQALTALSTIALNAPQDCGAEVVTREASVDTDGSCAGGMATRSEPLLGQRTGTGASVRHVPLVGSPLIDAGDTVCRDVDGGTLDSDQLGAARPADATLVGTARCDVGAIELAAGESRPDGTDPDLEQPGGSTPDAPGSKVEPPDGATPDDDERPGGTARDDRRGGAASDRPATGGARPLQRPTSLSVEALETELDARQDERTEAVGDELEQLDDEETVGGSEVGQTSDEAADDEGAVDGEAPAASDTVEPATTVDDDGGGALAAWLVGLGLVLVVAGGLAVRRLRSRA